MDEEKLRLAREMVCRQEIGGVLEEHGITEGDFLVWLEDGTLAEYLYRMAKTKARAKIPEVWLKLERLAAEGDLKAIKLYCDICEKGQENGADGAADRYCINPEVEAIRKEIFGDV